MQPFLRKFLEDVLQQRRCRTYKMVDILQEFKGKKKRTACKDLALIRTKSTLIRTKSQ